MKTLQKTAIKAFIEALHHYDSNCVQLDELLTKEQGCIVSLDQQQLLQLLPEKQTLLEQLEQQQIDIDHLCQEEFSCPASSESMRSLFKNAKKQLANAQKNNAPVSFSHQDIQLWQEKWQQFVLHVEQLESKNQLNGQLLNRQTVKNQLLIAMLRGDSNKTNLYGEDGRNQNQANHIDLGRA